jgi:lysophospholipase L1-like esterase
MRFFCRESCPCSFSAAALWVGGAILLACSADPATTPGGSGGAAASNAGGAGATTTDGAGGGGAGGVGGTSGGSSGAGGVRDASADTGGASPDGSGGSGGADAGDARGARGGAAGGTGGSSVDASSEGSGNDGNGSDGRDGGADATTVVAAGVRWMGRVDTSNASAPRFSWTMVGFAAQFSGTSVGVDLENDDAYFFQAVIDGQKVERFQAAKGRATRTVASGLGAGPHTLELYREIETYYGTSQFFGITEATLQTPPPSRGRLLEFVGDSITAGYGNLGNEPHPNYGNPSPCPFSFGTESGYMSYGAVTARALGADASIIAESGWGVYRSRTSDTNEVLPKVYDRVLGNNATPLWDFRTTPQAVVINLGTNDFAPGDPGNAYTTALGAFVDTVRGRYPGAWIVCAVGTMYSDAEHSKALSYAQTVVNARGGDSGKVAAVDLGSQDALQGTGCDWHPNVAEDQRMANVLVPVLRQKLGW